MANRLAYMQMVFLMCCGVSKNETRLSKISAGTLAFSVGVRDTASCGLLQENKILAQSADITVRHWRVVLKLGTTL